MPDNCGAPTAFDKLQERVADKVEVDETAEYFQFSPTNTTDGQASAWATEFRTDNELESAFSRISLSNGAKHDWSRQFLDTNKVERDWSKEFLGKSEVSNRGNETAWTSEYLKDSPTVASSATAADWVNEFTNQTNGEINESLELQRTARDILANLQTERDPKLANSRFVAYLKELAGTDVLSARQIKTERADFDQWKQQYLNSVAHLSTPESEEWLKMEKTWDKYEGTGYGYKDFAKKEFGTYQLSVPLTANRFSSYSDAELRTILSGAGNNLLPDCILAAEVLISRDSSDGGAWKSLGFNQQANEMDAQAIAAFLNVTKLCPNDREAWIALAASCANESCMVDCYDAIRNCLKFSGSANVTAEMVEAEYLKMPDSTNALALAIIHSISGNSEKAINILSGLSESSSHWSLRNRLAAIFANSRRYDDALTVYDQLLREGHDYPRVHYNKGIALMCNERHHEASRSFIAAIDKQVPVDVIEGVRDELLPSYRAPWEALKVNLSLAGRDDLASLEPSSLSIIKAALATDSF